MAEYEGQPVYATCRIVSATRAQNGNMDYLIHADFTRQLPIFFEGNFGNPQFSEDVIVNTDIQPTDSEISSALRIGTAQQLNVRYPYNWAEADIRGLSL